MRIATLNDFQLNSFTLFFGVDFQTLDFGWLALFLTVVILNVVQRAAYWRWAGFLALNFNRRTEVEFCTSVDTKPFSPPIANTMLYDVVMFWVLVQLNIFVCHFLIYPGICTLIFLTIQFLFLKLNQSLKIEQSNFPLYRSLKMFVLF